MASILVIGYEKEERDGLARGLEFAGHRCATADSLGGAVIRMQKESYDVVLADCLLDDGNSDRIVQTLKSASPSVTVMILSEDAPRRDEEVLTHHLSPIRNLSPQFSQVGQAAALLVLLPEQDSLKFLTHIPKKAGLLNKLAVLYHSQEKYSAAERLYKEALKVSEEKPLHKRALKSDEKESKSEIRAVASILNNLARLYHDQKKFKQAEPLYLRSLGIVEKLSGPNDPKMVRRLRNLAELYRVQGLIDKAVEMDARLKLIERAAVSSQPR